MTSVCMYACCHTHQYRQVFHSTAESLGHTDRLHWCSFDRHLTASTQCIHPYHSAPQSRWDEFLLRAVLSYQYIWRSVIQIVLPTHPPLQVPAPLQDMSSTTLAVCVPGHKCLCSEGQHRSHHTHQHWMKHIACAVHYSGFEVTCPDCDLQSALDHAARDK